MCTNIRFQCVRVFCLLSREKKRRGNRRKSGKKKHVQFMDFWCPEIHFNSQIAIHYAVIVGCIYKLLLACVNASDDDDDDDIVDFVEHHRIQCGSCMCIVSAMRESTHKKKENDNERRRKKNNERHKMKCWKRKKKE